MSSPSEKEPKVAVVTGANSGIGKVTVSSLLKQGYRVIATARSKERGEAALADWKKEVPDGNVTLVLCNLSDLKSVREAARQIAEQVTRIDVLLNNAGGIIGQRHVTPEGLEETLGGNHLGHFVLTQALLPLLEKMRARGATGRDPVVWMPDDRKQATGFRAHLKLAGITRHALLHSEGRRSMHVTFHDLRAGGVTYCAVRNDPPVQIQRRAGHERFETTLLYIRIAESVDAASFGKPFAALPESLLKTPAGISSPGRKSVALTLRQDEGIALRSPAHSPSGISSREGVFSSPTPIFVGVSQRREGDSNPWNPCELT